MIYFRQEGGGLGTIDYGEEYNLPAVQEPETIRTELLEALKKMHMIPKPEDRTAFLTLIK